jgi:hypothetical protein
MIITIVDVTNNPTNQSINQLTPSILMSELHFELRLLNIHIKTNSGNNQHHYFIFSLSVWEKRSSYYDHFRVVAGVVIIQKL